MLDNAEQVALNVDPNVVSDTPIGTRFQPVADFIVNLLDEEGRAHKGQAIEEHVGKDQAYLQRRIRESIRGTRIFGHGYSRSGSFPSLAAANKLINAVLDANRSLVDDVVQGRVPRARLDKWFTSPTGAEAFTDRPWDPSAPIGFRETFGAAVVILRNPAIRKGFSIITAFPFFDVKE